MANGPEEVDIADWMGKVSVELIGQACLGYSFGTLGGRNDKFCRAVEEWMSVQRKVAAICLSDMLSSPTSSSLTVARHLFPFVAKVFHPKVLKFLGRALPWPELHHFMDLAETLHSKSRGIYETKKRLLELGDDVTVRQVGDGKDIIGILSAYNALRLYIRNLMRLFIVQASTTGPEDDWLSEEELVSQMAYVSQRVFIVRR